MSCHVMVNKRLQGPMKGPLKSGGSWAGLGAGRGNAGHWGMPDEALEHSDIDDAGAHIGTQLSLSVVISGCNR
jgi:hypothetical protein